MAAGMNELFTAPLLARQKGSYDWEESINAITRHVIEEFSNLQHFVPYLYSKCTLLGECKLRRLRTAHTSCAAEYGYTCALCTSTLFGSQ
jgi:hypothetical protein